MLAAAVASAAESQPGAAEQRGSPGSPVFEQALLLPGQFSNQRGSLQQQSRQRDLCSIFTSDSCCADFIRVSV